MLFKMQSVIIAFLSIAAIIVSASSLRRIDGSLAHHRLLRLGDGDKDGNIDNFVDPVLHLQRDLQYDWTEPPEWTVPPDIWYSATLAPEEDLTAAAREAAGVAAGILVVVLIVCCFACDCLYRWRANGSSAAAAASSSSSSSAAGGGGGGGGSNMLVMMPPAAPVYFPQPQPPLMFYNSYPPQAPVPVVYEATPVPPPPEAPRK